MPSRRCVLASGHDGDHVYPTRKPIGDRYKDGEFKGRMLSIPGVTVPGNVRRCRSAYRFEYVVEIDGDTVRIDSPRRYVLLWLRVDYWLIRTSSDSLEELEGWWEHGDLDIRVFDQELGHLWEPRLELVRSFHEDDVVREVRMVR